MTTAAEPQLNATPLIDVLLVLLVMLILTLPVATHAVKLNLPQASRDAPLPEPRPLVRVDIDFDGQMFWNGRHVADREDLEHKLREAGGALPAPRIKVVPDKRVRYEHVAKVLAAAQRSRVTALEVAPIQF